MHTPLSNRALGYLVLLYLVVVAFFALVEVDPLMLAAIAVVGAAGLTALVSRSRTVRRHRRG